MSTMHLMLSKALGNLSNFCNVVILENVLYVPGICKNLISISAIATHGHRIVFRQCHCVDRYSQGGLYRLDAYDRCSDSSAHDAHAVDIDLLPDTYLWHERFGHLNFGDLVKLPNIVEDMPHMHMPNKHVCEACLLGKIHCFAISKDGKVGASHRLYLAHNDICGPICTASLGGFY